MSKNKNLKPNMTEQQPAVSLLREQLQQAHGWLEATMADVTPTLAHDTPPGKPNPIGAQYGHVLTAEDMFVNAVIGGGAPLMASTFAGKTGMSESMPLNPGWDEWARRVQIDLPAIREYAQAVYAATDAKLIGMVDEDLSREVILSFGGEWPTTAGQLLNNLLLNAYSHAGEISCLKGMHGQRGYPA